ATSGPPPCVRTGASLGGPNSLFLTWPKNPGPTSITVTYPSLGDRELYIDASGNSGPGGSPSQYKVDLVSTAELSEAPSFSDTVRYLAPTVSFPVGSPFLTGNGQLGVAVYANAYTPKAGQPGHTPKRPAHSTTAPQHPP